MLRKVTKYGLIGAAGALSVASLQRNDWNVNSLPMVRLGRAAATTTMIAIDYKRLTHNTELNEDLTAWSDTHFKAANRILRLCTANGGVFIKVGQHIASLEYLVPQEYCQVLKVLHNRAPLSSLADVKDVIKKDLGQSTEQLFKEFDETPLGTASLAQVHKAVLQSGETVAVKVQHKNVRMHSLIDIVSIDFLVSTIARLFPEFSFKWLSEEMRINLPLELDFLNEGKNCERVQQMYKQKFSWFFAPHIYWDYSSHRVLTMEFMEGGQINDRKFIEENKIDALTLTSRLSHLYSDMIFVQGFVHCDPHPGNILVRQSKNGPEVVLLDHGLYSTLGDQFRTNYSHLWYSMINKDLDGIKEWSIRLGAGDLYNLLACILAAKPWSAVSEGLTKVRNVEEQQKERKELKQYAQQYFPSIAKILNRVPREMLLILKTNDLLRGLETSLGTKDQRTSLITMSQYCVKAIYAENRSKVNWWMARARLNFSEQIILCKLLIYQWCLRISAFIYGVRYL